MLRTWTFTLYWVLSALAFSAAAATTQRNLERQGDDYVLSYRWQGFDEQQHRITLDYPVTLLHNSFRKYRAYQPERANRELRYQLTRYARSQGWRNVEVVLRQREKVLEIRQRGKQNPEILRNMQQKHAELLAQHLRDNFYNELTDHTGRTGIKPDHVRIAEASEDIVVPLANAFSNLLGENSQREYLEAILTFMQGIPYQSLEDRIKSSGAGFNPPAKILLEHRADCDSKVTLMGGILRQLMPDVPIYAVYVPEHAFLALRMSRRDDEQTIEIDGQNFLVVEPTGPARLKIGELSETSARYVGGQQYRTERFL